MEPATVHIQGISPDLSEANGDFGEQSTYGLQTPEQLLDFFTRVQHLRAPPGDDVCPPSAVFESASQTLHFTMETGQIWCGEAGAVLTVEQAVHVVRYPGTVATVRQQMQARSGLVPVRMPQVPPTDPELSISDINTGPASPQVSFQLVKSGDSRQNVWVSYGISAVILALAAMPLMSGDIVGGAVVAGIAAVPFTIGRYLSTRTHQIVRFGFDWTTNTLWCQDSEVVRFMANANLITGLRLDYGTEESWEHIEGNHSRMDYAQVYADYIDGSKDALLLKIYGKKEGPRVLEALTQLMNQQG